MASDSRRAAVSILAGRTTLALFGLLAAGWFLPAVYPPLAATPLIIPPYLVIIVTYDGLFGLEHAAYAAAELLPIAEHVVFDAGLVVTFYLFAVVAVALGGALKRRVGPKTAGSEQTARTLGRFGYAVAAGLLVLGLLLAAQGAAAQPTVTSETCTGASAAGDGGGSTVTATPTCTTTTEPATGQQIYIVSLGAGIAALGAGIVGVDRWLAAR